MYQAKPVVIVGAGLSGLGAAWALRQAGLESLVLESRRRVGGRVLTESVHLNDHASAAIDLGPSWFWPGQPLVTGLLDRFGIPSFVQHDTGDSLFETHGGAIHRNPPPSPMAGAMRVRGGLGRLARAIADDLPADTVAFGQRVTAISDADELIRVESEDAGRHRAYTAPRVALAIPPRLIPGLSFNPALPEAARHELERVPTWMAGHAKFFAVYDRPFWRDAGLSGSAFSTIGPLAEVHDASPVPDGSGPPPGALFGFVRVPAAQRRQLGAEEVTRQSLQQLAKLFGDDAASPHTTRLMDWSVEPNTASSADQDPPAGHPAYGMNLDLGPTWSSRITPIASETSYTFGGLVEGALQAGFRFAEQVKHGSPARA
ncbi:MAG: FAD-dependent oxidoreductase [Planctomycetota bacterium]